MSRLLTIDDLTHPQRVYLRFLHRASQPGPRRPMQVTRPSSASLSVLHEMKLISPLNAHKRFMGMPRPMHLIDWEITDRGRALVEAADAADLSIEAYHG